jgi:hypothetical protein
VFLAAVFDLPSFVVLVPPATVLISTQSSPKRFLVVSALPGQIICGNPFHAQILRVLGALTSGLLDLQAAGSVSGTRMTPARKSTASRVTVMRIGVSSI